MDLKFKMLLLLLILPGFICGIDVQQQQGEEEDVSSFEEGPYENDYLQDGGDAKPNAGANTKSMLRKQLLKGYANWKFTLP